MRRLEPSRREAAMARSADRSSIADDRPELQQLSVQVFSCHDKYMYSCTCAGVKEPFDSRTEIMGQP